MKFYIAARVGAKEDVRKIIAFIKNKGHELHTDWTEHTPPRPYDKEPEISRKYAVEDLEAAADCDVFILVSDEAGTGMYTEFGVAIANNLIKGKPKVYVIGEHLSRSMFFFHPSVERKNNIEEVFEDLGL
jgi:hypothetical protein